MDRKVIPSESAFDTITTIHCKHAHPGKNKTFDLIREKYYGITKEEVSYNILIFYIMCTKIFIGSLGN